MVDRAFRLKTGKLAVLAAAVLLLTALKGQGWCGGLPVPNLSVGVDTVTKPGEISNVIQIFLVMTVMSLAPSIVIMTTSFTRIVVVLGFLRSAMGTQSAPSNQIVIGLSLFLTLFIMSPVMTQVNNQAVVPYRNKMITQDQALNNAIQPLRKFMLSQTREADVALFVNLSKLPRPKTADDVPTLTLIPAFMVSELRTAFQIGFLIFIPFLVVDMVVASVLMSMGMMMLPPAMISLPFKILLFVMVDGWTLVLTSLVKSYQ